jgi:hypothetical protein
MKFFCIQLIHRGLRVLRGKCLLKCRHSTTGWCIENCYLSFDEVVFLPVLNHR